MVKRSRFDGVDGLLSSRMVLRGEPGGQVLFGLRAPGGAGAAVGHARSVRANIMASFACPGWPVDIGPELMSLSIRPAGRPGLPQSPRVVVSCPVRYCDVGEREWSEVGDRGVRGRRAHRRADRAQYFGVALLLVSSLSKTARVDVGHAHEMGPAGFCRSGRRVMESGRSMSCSARRH
jgi:hypothetical protein